MSRRNDPPDLGRRLTLMDVAAIALAAGFLVAAIETGSMAAFRWVTPKIMRTGDSFIWIIPLYYAVVFSALGLGLGLVTRFLSRSFTIRLVVGASSALAGFIILLLSFYGGVNQWALALLAIGVGVQAGRLAVRHEAGLMRVARVLIVVLGIPLAIAALGIVSLSRWREKAWYHEAPLARPGAPNVLLIILDTVRAASLGLYGNERPTTPNLERQANSWVVFDHAYATAPWTLPSHSSIFTGFYPHQLSANWLTPLDGAKPTLAEAFRNQGYRTGGFVANMNYASAETGLGRGFVHYEDYPLSRMYLRRATALGYFLDTWRDTVKPGRRSRANKQAGRIDLDFLTWVDKTEGRPFFAFLNYYDAHQPYQAPDSLRRRFQSADKGRDGYEAAIASLDQELGQLVDQLSSRHLLENTVLVITSDHGELLGEHNLVGHANSLYQEVLEVPLLIRYDGRTPRGLRIMPPVTLRDLAATVTDLAGLPQSFPGSSLTRFWDSTRGSNPPSPLIAYVSKGIRTPPEEPVSRGAMKSIFRDDFQLILNGDGQEELFDLRTDPRGKENLADTDSAKSTRRMLRTALDAAFAATDSSSRRQTAARAGT